MRIIKKQNGQRRTFSTFFKREKVELLDQGKISEENKNVELLQRIADLEHIIRKKQMEIDYYKTTLEAISESAGEDLEKKYKPK